MNIFWFVGVTMTTVGYGDYYPQTLSGRFFSFIIFIWGIFFISIAFVSLINIIQLSINEQNALSVIKKLVTIKDLKNNAAKLVTYTIRLKVLRNKIEKEGLTFGNNIRLAIIENKLKKLTLRYKRIKRRLVLLKNDLDFVQYLVNNMDYVNFILKDIDKNQSVILEKVIELKEGVLKTNMK